MLKLRDRIYGALDLPDEAWKLASSCAVLLRLREIRMANIPFLSYPSFANVDRYEHSLGVAHLAWRWARNNNLPEESALALTLAALYHDGGTPALGHLFEEYLFRFGWDHEGALVELLLGTTVLPGRSHAQVFLGGYCKLEEVLKRSPAGLTVTPAAVADLASGDQPLGRLIKGDLDLDNIDNVLRASSAMGLLDCRNGVHPYEVADALVWEDGDIRIRPDRFHAVAAWSEARFTLYDQILNNAHEFRAQTALKWAIEVCAGSDPALKNASGWLLTDPELLFEHLRGEPFARMLVDRVRRGRPPELLFSAWIDDLSPLLGQSSGEIMSRVRVLLEERCGMKIHINFYVDKRKRNIRMGFSQEPVLFSSSMEPTFGQQSAVKPPPCGVLGIVGIGEGDYVGAYGKADPKRDPTSRKRGFGAEEFREVLEVALGQKLRAASNSWVGTQGAPEQLRLFAST